jgi:ATP-dependent Clp protease adaptor protein ClpS
MTDQAAQSADVQSTGGGADAATLEKIERKPAPPDRKPKQLPPYRVLLHNDDVNTMEHVVLSIVRLTPLETEQAVLRTLEAHESGVALLLVTHQERAELYQEQFTSLSLTVTIEPAE